MEIFDKQSIDLIDRMRTDRLERQIEDLRNISRSAELNSITAKSNAEHAAEDATFSLVLSIISACAALFAIGAAIASAMA